MTARETVEIMIRTDRGSMTVWSPPEVQKALDAYRAEVRAADALTAAERQFLTFALDLAFDAMVSCDGFTDEDEAALARFRRMAAGTTP